MSKKVKIAIVGGGVAGVSTALWLGELGLDVTLFERENSLVSGPPFCHLHAGGNLYREISDEQCIKLLKQSIDFAKFYPFVIDYRPTVIALPTYDKQKPSDLLDRLNLLQSKYKELIEEDKSNKILGESENYYQLYSKEKILELKESSSSTLSSSDRWMRTLSKELDFDKVQFPLILVQEYGLNLFRLASGATLALKKLPNVNLKLNSLVTDIKKQNDKFIIESNNTKDEFDYLINATGFRTGTIDDMLGVSCKRMVEFKSAYITHWNSAKERNFPEVIFHGERGTPQGMGQFTPYPSGYFQLHGMTEDITLYRDGLVSSSPTSSQPKLKESFIEKIEKSWSKDEIEIRTNRAIKHISKFIPSFSEAKVGSKPLFGAQQIPGDDPSLRVAEVSFDAKKYARCEIVKVSSVIDMVDAIAKDIASFGYLNNYQEKQNTPISKTIYTLKENEIKNLAKEIAVNREYPSALSFKMDENNL
jgi:hypothetical protein